MPTRLLGSGTFSMPWVIFSTLNSISIPITPRCLIGVVFPYSMGLMLQDIKSWASFLSIAAGVVGSTMDECIRFFSLFFSLPYCIFFVVNWMYFSFNLHVFAHGPLPIPLPIWWLKKHKFIATRLSDFLYLMKFFWFIINKLRFRDTDRENIFLCYTRIYRILIAPYFLHS